MIYYGDCEVRWSYYNITGNTLSDIQTRTFNKSGKCSSTNLDQPVLQHFFDQVKYVDYAKTQNVPFILFYDKDLNHLATFHTTSPTYPPVR